MSWSEDLLDASFRGVVFDVIKTQDTSSRAIVQHEYPYLNGADIEDLGRKPRNVRMTAVFWGDDYERELQTFLKAFDKMGKGELIHPVFGSMPNMQPLECQIAHDAERPDYCEVELAFLEATTGNDFFTREFPTSKADEIFNKIQALLDKTQNLLDKVLSPLRTAKKMMAKAKALTSIALNMVLIFRSEIVGFISSAKDFINYPGAFLSDLRTALSIKSLDSKSSISNRYGGNRATTTLADWKEIKSQLDAVAALPSALVTGETSATLPIPNGATAEDLKELIVVVAIEAVAELATNAVNILSDDELLKILSPVDIEQINNDVRETLQSAIDQQRELYTSTLLTVSSATENIGVLWQPIIADLKDIALQIQHLAAAAITTKPPLVQRTVNSATNLHLLAHLWYGDYRRAGELERLNPQLPDPNNITAGDTLYAYAE